MLIARVKGHVVSTHKSERLQGLKLLLVVPVDMNTFKEKGLPIVAIDTVGAGMDEIVMLCSGSSSRLTEQTEGKPSDMAVIGIIDSIEYQEKMIYKKHATGGEGHNGNKR